MMAGRHVLLCFGLLLLPATAALAEPPLLSAVQKETLRTHVANRYPFTRSRFKWSEMKAAQAPMPLLGGAMDSEFRWRINGQSLTLDAYLDRQPITGLLIARDGKLLYERYQYGTSAQSLFISNSMAKSLTGLAFGFLEAEGRLKEAGVSTESILPALAGTPMGETSLRNHLRMGSGVAYRETYEPDDDRAGFREITRTKGQLEALRSLTRREHPQGEAFHYMGPSSATLSLVVQALAGRNLAAYLGPRLWERIGTEHPAIWQEDAVGSTQGQCCIFARPRDYLRLGIVLSHDGQNPVSGQQVIPRDFLPRSTTAANLDPAFAPRRGSWGYENQIWVMHGPARQFALLGVYGQHIFVHPELKLVVVQFAVNETALAGKTSMLREREALWAALVRHFEKR